MVMRRTKNRKDKNRVTTTNLRTIRRSFPRFVSLMVMSFLGVFVFAGLSATAPDMIKTLDDNLDSHNAYDIRVLSDMGLEQADIDALAALDVVETVEGVRSLDVIAAYGEKDCVMNVTSLPKQINRIDLLEGRLPEAADEIAVEANFLTKEDMALGDTITLESDDLTEQTVTIVGTVNSALYYNNVMINQTRGNTSIGSGTIKYYAYGVKSLFDMDCDTCLYLTVAGAEEKVTSYEDYTALVDEVKDEVEDLAEAREQARYDSLYGDAEQEIEDAQAEADEELSDAWEELDKAKAQLDEAGQELSDARLELTDARTQLDNAKEQLTEAEQTLADKKAELAAAQTQLADTRARLDSEEEKLAEAKTRLDASKEQLDELKSQIDLLNAGLAAGLLTEEDLAQLAQLQAVYDAGLAQYQEGLAEYEAGAAQISQAEDQYAEGEAQYQSGLAAYDEGLAQYEASTSEYNSGEASYAENLQRYEESLQEYEDGQEDYEDGLAEYEEAKAEAEQEIADARAQLADLTLPTWYVYDRTGSTTYNDYIDDSNSVRNLASIFPIVFFAVAVLVSLISMNRMVEENRLEIGTMKSMGFPDSMILSKYLLFSLLATLLGGILGAAGGLIVIPELIFYIYTILFTLPAMTLTLQPVYTSVGFALTVLCVCGTSVYTVFKVLREKPAELLRPKPPKNGKRILLEKISFLWNHMRFSQKVTARNIFRYKKRVLVTIGGIAGCTALILSGFGVKDAIIDVPSAQYYGIYRFDATAYVSDYCEEETDGGTAAEDEAGDGESDGVSAADFLAYESVTSAVPAQRITADIEGINGFLQIVDRDEDLERIAAFTDDRTGEPLTLTPGKAIINEKLATMTGLKAGDTITLVDVDNRTMRVEIGSVAKNYIEHFVFIDAETYEAMGYDFAPNQVYLNTTELDQAGKDALAEEILLNDHVLNVTYRSTLIDDVDDSLQSLNSVVVILIVLSALLAFVVLYNLSNINIAERRREIATLKVLGFYDQEVDSYITKENILLTILGIAIGLILGIFLSHAVVNTIEVEKCRFMNSLRPMSYVWSALIAVGFTLIVNVITHFNLKRIDMIDSLKSVE